MSKTGYRVSFVDAVDGDVHDPSPSTRARPKFQKSQTTPVLQEASEAAGWEVFFQGKVPCWGLRDFQIFPGNYGDD